MRCASASVMRWYTAFGSRSATRVICAAAMRVSSARTALAPACASAAGVPESSSMRATCATYFVRSSAERASVLV